MRRSITILIGLLILIGCAPPSINTPAFTPTPLSPTSLPSRAHEAHDVLLHFLTSLHAKSYADAAPLYGGDYEQLRVFNPEISKTDYVALWTWACENQLLRCLEVRSATFQELHGDSYSFQVEFNNPDGSLFILGPCCGANETEMPPVSQFEYIVSRNANHKFVVMNMPPYVP